MTKNYKKERKYSRCTARINSIQILTGPSPGGPGGPGGP